MLPTFWFKGRALNADVVGAIPSCKCLTLLDLYSRQEVMILWFSRQNSAPSLVSIWIHVKVKQVHLTL